MTTSKVAPAASGALTFAGRSSDGMIGPAVSATHWWPIGHDHTVPQPTNQMGGHSSATIPSPAPGRVPVFTVSRAA